MTPALDRALSSSPNLAADMPLWLVFSHPSQPVSFQQASPLRRLCRQRAPTFRPKSCVLAYTDVLGTLRRCATHLCTSFLQSPGELGGVADQRACVRCAMQQQHRGQRLPPLHTLRALTRTEAAFTYCRRVRSLKTMFWQPAFTRPPNCKLFTMQHNGASNLLVNGFQDVKRDMTKYLTQYRYGLLQSSMSFSLWRL